MRVVVFNAKRYDQDFLLASNAVHHHDLVFLEPRLSDETARLCKGFDVVCAFVNDSLNKSNLAVLSSAGIGLIALRCAGFNNIDLQAADELGLTVMRVPEYSPNGVAEHALALILALNRKIYRAHNRVRENNFSLDGLLGFEIHGKKVGVIGSGRIGFLFAKIMKGLSADVIAYDTFKNPLCNQLDIGYVDLGTLYKQSDIISLHIPLLPETKHIINARAIGQMKDGVMLINTSRGGLIDTRAVISGLKSGKIGNLGLDVYEEEEDLFFEDLSNIVIQDDIFARLLTFPNVIITGHQAYFTDTALKNIADTTLQNITDFAAGKPRPENIVTIRNQQK